MLEFAADPGALDLASATLTADEGLVKHYLIQREDVSLVDVLAEVGRERELKDIAIEEPSIEEVIRTFYGRQNEAVRGVSAYLAFAQSAFQTSLAYRNEVWANLFGKLMQVLARVAIWFAVYAGAASIGGVSLEEMITYALLGGAVTGAIRYEAIVGGIGNALKTGDVAVWLLKPVSFPLYIIVSELGGLGLPVSLHGGADGRGGRADLRHAAAGVRLSRRDVRPLLAPRLRDHQPHLGAVRPPRLLAPHLVRARMDDAGAAQSTLGSPHPVLVLPGAVRRRSPGTCPSPGSSTTLRRSGSGVSRRRKRSPISVSGSAGPRRWPSASRGFGARPRRASSCRAADACLARLRLIPFLLQMNLKARMEYRADFWINGIAQIITYSSSIAVLWILVNRFGDLAGWTFPDLAFLFSFHMLGYSIGASMSFVQMRDLEEQVRLGTFDVLMTKPISTWVFIVFSRFNLGYTAHVILGVAVMAWALMTAEIDWSIGWVLYFIASMLSAALVTGAIMTAIGTTALIWTRSNHLYSLYFGFWELSRYPLEIFPAGIQWVMLTIVPMAFMAAVPCAVLLGKDVPILGDWAGPAALLAGPLVVLVSMALWRYAMNRYQGAGG